MFYSCSNVTFYDATFYCSLFLLSFQFTLDFLLAEIILFVDCSIPVVVCRNYIIPLLYTRIPFMSNCKEYGNKIIPTGKSFFVIFLDIYYGIKSRKSNTCNTQCLVTVTCLFTPGKQKVLDDWRFGILKILFHNYT